MKGRGNINGHWMASSTLYENTRHEEDAKPNVLVVKCCREDKPEYKKEKRTHLELFLELAAQPSHVKKVVDGAFVRVVRPQKFRTVRVV